MKMTGKQNAEAVDNIDEAVVWYCDVHSHLFWWWATIKLASIKVVPNVRGERHPVIGDILCGLTLPWEWMSHMCECVFKRFVEDIVDGNV
jgi:hypothetical protein